MASEDRADFFGILFVRSEALQIFAGTAAAVIQQDGGERSAALRAPQHRVKGSRPTMDDDGFWPARSLGPGRRYRECYNERHQNERVQLCHLAFPNHWIPRMPLILSEWAQYILIAAKSEFARQQ